MIRPNVPENIESQIKSLSEGTIELWKKCHFSKIENNLLKAWSLLPEPKLSWDYYPQIIARGLVSCYTYMNNHEDAKKWMLVVREAYEAPELGDDPSVDFWEAQMDFELGLQEKAFEEFHCLYKKFKKRPFKGHDSKYLDFYLTNLKK